MRNIIPSILLIMGILFSMAVDAQESGALDGKKFLIQLKRKGWKPSRWKQDTLFFYEGKVVAIGLEERERFHGRSYHPVLKETKTGTIVEFSYWNYNGTGSKLEISGTVNSDQIEGKAIWRSLAGEQQYKFTGVLVM